jgi:putative heme iron utilization protein
MDPAAADLLSAARHGALATLTGDGHPYASLVALASEGGEPLFLLSELAEHTRNLRRDARASLLVASAAGGDPLALPRATFVGRCVPESDGELAAVYVAAHPSAASYLEMKDFGLWRLRVEAVRTIGGFGVMGWSPGRP